MPPNPPVNSKQHSPEYISLRDYFDTRIAAMEKATEVAYENMERRLDGMNEFRSTLRDQAFTFLTKMEYQSFKDRMDNDIRFLRESRSLLEGKASQSAVNSLTIISVVSLILAVVSLLLRIFGI